jgi:hypothetical protein
MTKKEEEAKQTMCYSFEVAMVVQIFAEDEASAKTKLDSEGGFVSKRSITLKDAVPLYSGEKS